MSNTSNDDRRQQLLRGFKRTIMNATPEDAMLLRILIEAKGAKCGVEVGSFNGYGTINMGIAFEHTCGKLTTIEVDPTLAAQTRENVIRCELQDTVDAIQGDALRVLPDIKGPIDFVFLDAAKEQYFDYFKALQANLASGALLVADNAVLSREKMRDFLEYIENSPDWEIVVIRASSEKGDGMAICRNIKPVHKDVV
jgi:predicted O-methyltransferase YrrM